MSVLAPNGKGGHLQMSRSFLKNFFTCPVIDRQIHINLGNLDLSHHTVALNIEHILIVVRQDISAAHNKWVVYRIPCKVLIVDLCFFPCRVDLFLIHGLHLRMISTDRILLSALREEITYRRIKENPGAHRKDQQGRQEQQRVRLTFIRLYLFLIHKR